MVEVAKYSVEQIKTGSDEVTHTSVKIAANQVIAALTPIGQVTASGEFIESKADATDGSQKPLFFTQFEIKTTTAVNKMVVKSGTFDPTKLKWDDSWSDSKKLTAFVGTPISLQTTESPSV